jgi:hypothetical protein
MVFKWHFQQYFSYIVAVSFISGENLEYQEKTWSTRRKPGVPGENPETTSNLSQVTDKL